MNFLKYVIKEWHKDLPYEHVMGNFGWFRRFLGGDYN